MKLKDIFTLKLTNDYEKIKSFHNFNGQNFLNRRGVEMLNALENLKEVMEKYTTIESMLFDECNGTIELDTMACDYINTFFENRYYPAELQVRKSDGTFEVRCFNNMYLAMLETFLTYDGLDDAVECVLYNVEGKEVARVNEYV